MATLRGDAATRWRFSFGDQHDCGELNWTDPGAFAANHAKCCAAYHDGSKSAKDGTCDCYGKTGPCLVCGGIATVAGLQKIKDMHVPRLKCTSKMIRPKGFQPDGCKKWGQGTYEYPCLNDCPTCMEFLQGQLANLGYPTTATPKVDIMDAFLTCWKCDVPLEAGDKGTFECPQCRGPGAFECACLLCGAAMDPMITEHAKEVSLTETTSKSTRTSRNSARTSSPAKRSPTRSLPRSLVSPARQT